MRKKLKESEHFLLYNWKYKATTTDHMLCNFFRFKGKKKNFFLLCHECFQYCERQTFASYVVCMWRLPLLLSGLNVIERKNFNFIFIFKGAAHDAKKTKKGFIESDYDARSFEDNQSHFSWIAGLPQKFSLVHKTIKRSEMPLKAMLSNKIF